ncbi:uncharacterized protein LOC111076287 [Drosophila obscura]|uniref:uncharacterized protein LOC111076287 n=1 Tax=Drosophila obscura TaxID=7282 RepID=UPI001BB1EC9A|nr:uncharacterized protein LOC111076287 [Drosophila obscura]
MYAVHIYQRSSNICLKWEYSLQEAYPGLCKLNLIACKMINVAPNSLDHCVVLKNIHSIAISQLRMVMRFILILFLIAMTTSASIDDGCKSFCPFVINPVCAFDENGVGHDLANSCRLEMAECQRKNIKLPPFKKVTFTHCPTRKR